MAQHRPVGPGDRVFLVDGSGYIFRAYHALPPLSRKSDGLPVGAVSGFCNMLFKLMEDMKASDAPTHLAVIFDKSEHTFRNELYPEYKAHRPPAPEDLVPQFPLIRDAVRAFGLPCLEMAGFEADDLIATYARQAEAEGAEVVIVSSDKDLMQLVSDKITLLDTMKSKSIDAQGVMEKFGVGPDKVIEVQALAGDSVDNVPGVPGVGVKTAAQLIEEYGDLEGLLAAARNGEITQKKRRENLVDHAEAARISKTLVTLKTDVAVEDPLEAFGLDEPDLDTLTAFLEAMEFRTLTRRVKEALTGAPASADAAAEESGVDRSKYDTVDTLEALDAWIARAHEAGVIAFDTETDSLDAAAAILVGVSLAVGPNAACYIPLGHRGGDLAEGAEGPKQIPLKDALDRLKPLLEAPGVLKVAHNFKYDAAVLARYGVRVSPHDDTLLISYVLASGLHGHGMDELSERRFGHTPIPFKEVCGSGKSMITFDHVAVPQATQYAAEDADITLRLWRAMKPELQRAGLLTVYETLERPLAPVIADMELAGVKVDPDTLSRLSGDFAQRMAGLEAQAHELAGHPFNLGSPKQIGEILFGEMGLPGGKKTKTGAYSTGAQVLEELAAVGHDLPQTLLDWRQISKLKSTYTDALREAINTETGRIHTSYSMASTTTGRLSSSDPNLQNIPIRTEAGRKIRAAFIAEPGHVLIAADYSQIELRLLAHIADIAALKQAFAEGLDIHAMTASEMFGVPVDGMDPMVRRRAKAINFGIIYGISAYGLSNQLQIPQGEAASYIKAYFEKFPGIKAYMEDTKAAAREKGYVETIFGRRIHCPDIKAKAPANRAFAERQAINAPIQGSAADVIRRAMIRMPEALKAEGLAARMLLQVHDELVFEAPEAEADAVCTLAADVMVKAPLPANAISVPLVVDAKAGQTWGEAH
ncbi:MAG: DNA polymerase I [Maricaulaceae bacterium]